MISVMFGFVTLIFIGMIGILLTPVLCVGWFLIKFLFKAFFLIGILGIGLALLGFL